MLRSPSFENYLEQIYLNKYHQIAVAALKALRGNDRLDQATVDHSERTSRMCQVLGYAAGLKIGTATALSIGAELHDTGKEHCLDIISNGRQITQAERTVVQQHPEAGKVFSENLFKPDQQKLIPRLAVLLIGSHHTFNKESSQDYPAFDTLGVRSYEVPVLRRVGTLLAVADTIESLTNAEGRTYRKMRLRQEGIAQNNGVIGLHEAAGIACAQIIDIDVRYNMDASRITDLLAEQTEFLVTQSLAA